MPGDNDSEIDGEGGRGGERKERKKRKQRRREGDKLEGRREGQHRRQGAGGRGGEEKRRQIRTLVNLLLGIGQILIARRRHCRVLSVEATTLEADAFMNANQDGGEGVHKETEKPSLH